MATSVDQGNLSAAAATGSDALLEQAAPLSEAQILAQATDPAAKADPVPVDAGSGQPIQAAQPSTTPPVPEAVSGEYAADASNVVHLPANVSVDNIKVDGKNLILEQADGTEIVVKDAASNVPTFMLGDVELPRVALIAALEAGGVDVAFGPDGSISVGPGSANSSGGNFETPVGGIGNGFDLSALLPPTALQFPQYEYRELFPGGRRNRAPEMLDFAVRVSEEGLQNGIKDDSGSSDTTDQAIATGPFSATDADGDPLSYTFGVPSLPAGMAELYSGNDKIEWIGQGTSQLVGMANGLPIITITATGDSYSVVLSGPINHPISGSEDELTLVIPVTVSDGKGGTATANMSVTIEDDSPVNNAATVNLGTVHEDALNTAGAVGNSEGGQTVTASITAAQIAALVTAGADAPVAIALNAAVSGPSGLTQDGHAINFVYDANSGVINGVVADGPNAGGVVFTIAPNGSDFTFTLKDNVDHGALDVGGGDAETTSLSLANVFTATDSDGDAIVINAGASVTIENDIPVNNAATVNLGTVHEDALNTAGAVGNSEGGQTVTASITAAQIAALVTAGADAPVAIALNAAVSGPSGLTQDGHAINFVYDANSGVINGVVADGPNAGGVVFTIAPNGSDFTFTLKDNVDHGALDVGGGDAETTSLSLANVFTATDSDGDAIVINAGASVTIENDIPVNNAATVNLGTVHEDALNTAGAVGNSEGGQTVTASITAAQIAALVTAGADAPVAIALNAAVSGPSGLTQDGHAINFVYDANSGVINGVVADGPNAGGVVFTIAPNGSDFTFTLKDNVDHGALDVGGGDAETTSLSLANVFTATDSDGDAIVINAGASVTIENDIPVNNAATVNLGTVHEDALNTAGAVGNSEGGQTVTASITAAQIAALVTAGADAPVAIALNAAVSGPSGLTQDGHAINFVYDANSGVINGVVADGPNAGGVVFTIAPNGSDFTFTLKDNVDHGALDVGGGDAETTSLSLANVFTATDSDGDAIVINAGASVTIENDIPVNNAATVNLGTVHEDALNTAGAVGNSEGGQTVTASITAAQIAALVTAGADAPVAIALNAAVSGPSGLTQDGHAINFVYDANSGVINGVVADGPNAGGVVFTIAPNGSDFTFTLKDNVDHGALDVGGGDAETTSLSLANVFTATDSDGDAIVINAGASVTIENDIPVNNAATVNLGTVHEDALNTAGAVGNSEGGQTVTASITAAQIAALVTAGADAPVAIALNAAVSGPSGLTQDGHAINFVYDANSGVINGVVADGPNAGGVVFTIAPNGSDFTFTLKDNVDHGALDVGGGDAETTSLSLANVFTATDSDGDAIVINAGASVTIENDIPVNNAATVNLGTVHEDALNTAGAVGNSEGGQTVTASITAAQIAALVTAGADAPVAIALNAAVSGPSGLTQDGHAINFVYDANSGVINGVVADGPNAGGVVFTIAPNGSDFTFTLKDNVDHGALDVGGGDAETTSLSLANVFTATDSDGDAIVINAGASVTIENDIPVNNAATVNLGTVHEDALNTAGAVGNSEGGQTVTASITAAQIAALVTAGADAPVAIALNAAVSGPSGLTQDGHAINFVYDANSGVINGVVADGPNAGGVVFTIAPNGSDFTFTLKDNVDHGALDVGGGDAETTSLSLANVFTATDSDGDAIVINAGASVTIENDIPVNNAATVNLGTVHEDALNTAGAVGNSEGGQTVTASITAAQIAALVTAGADAPVAIALNAAVSGPSGLTQDGHAINFVYDANSGVINGVVADGPNAGGVVFTIAPNGSDFTFTLKDNVDHGALDVGGGDAETTSLSLANVFTATDSDGDAIVINAGASVTIENDIPVNNAATVNLGTVHEDALNTAGAVGNSEGGQTVTASITAAQIAALVTAGADAPVAIALNAAVSGPSGLTQDGHAINFVYDANSGVINGVVADGPNAGGVVFTIAPNGSDFTFTLKDNVDHGALDVGGGDAETTSLSLANVFTATDSDGDAIVINAGASVTIENDIPVNNAATVNLGTVHEDALNTAGAVGNSEGGQTVTASITAAQIAALVTAGADAPVAIALNAAVSGPSGLTQDGHAINFVYDANSGVINGVVADGPNAGGVVFTIAPNGSDFTFTLKDNVDHGALDVGGGDAETTSLSLANVFTATDSDGDAIVINAGASVTIENDIPVNNAATVNLGTVHEDALNTAGAVGNSEGGQTVTASITAAQIAALVTAGADAPVAIALNAAVSGPSGLTQDGHAINFVYDANSGVINGVVADGPNAGGVVFTIAPNGSDFTFTLKDNVDHGALDVGGGDAETTSLSLANVFTATDSDGDAIVINAGASVTIENDIPVNNAATVNLGTVHEDALNTAGAVGNSEGGQTVTASITAAQIAALVTAGADAPVAIALNAAVSGPSGLTQDGHAINFVYDANSGVINGVVADGPNAGGVVFTIAPNGSDFTFTLKDNVDHGALDVGGGDAETTSLSLANVFTATDSDGDAIVINAGASVTIENDIPVNNAATVNLGTVHEDALNTAGAVGNSEGGQTVTASITAAQIAALVTAGADAPVAIALNAAVSGPSGLTQDGHAINFVYDANSGVINGVVADGPNAGGVVFTIAPNGSDFTFTLKDNVDHGALDVGGGDAETTSLSLANVFTATDSDGDAIVINAGASVTIENDIPVNNAATVNLGTVHEDALNTAGAVGNSEGGQTVTASITAAQIAALVTAGADAPVAIALNAAVSGPSGLTQDGHAINFVYDANSGVINGVVADGPNAGGVVFTIAPNGSDFTFTLKDNVDHGALDVGGGDAETTSLSLANVFTATDSDGDAIVINAGASVTIENDIPVNNAATVNLGTVHEDALNTAGAVGNSEGGQTVTASITAAQIAALVTAGADAPVAIALNAAVSGPSGLTQDGHAINFVYDANSGVINGVVADGPNAGGVVFTIAPNGSDFTFTLKDNVDHGALDVGGGDAETTSLSLANVFTATDSDGDAIVINAGASVTIENDIPVNNAATVNLGTVHEDALNTAGAVGNSEGGQTVTASITAAQIAALVTAGADAPVAIALNAAVSGPSGLTQDGHAINFVYDANSGVINGVVADGPNAGGVVFTIAPNGSDFTFTLKDNVDHGALDVGGGDAETTSLSLANVFTATDSDGDAIVINAGASVTIENDIPELIAQDLAVYRVTGVTSGNYDFDVGADNAPFPQSFAAPALTWTNVPDGYTLALKPGTTATYQAQFVEDGVTKTYFEITIKADGTYDFNLVDAAPSVSVPSGNLLSGISGGSGLPSYTIPASTFGGAFSIVITGTNNGNADTLTISSTDLGVGDNVVHKNGDVLKFDLLQQAGYETSTLSTMTFSVASAGIAAGDDVSITVRYTDGTTQTFNEEVTAGPGGSMQLVVDGFNASKTVDYVTIDPVDSNMKITGVALSYTTTINPADQLLNFQLTGTDADGDKASDAFTVTVMAGTSGDDNITTGSSNDQVSGGAGNDTLNGGAGNDVLIGGTGNDVLNGGTGSDTASYSDSATPVRINLDDSGNAATDTVSLTPANGEVGGAAFGDDLIGIENLTGGSAGDYLAGNSSSNVLMGLGGDDFLFGENGNDILNGGSGQDTMTGGAGADTFVVSADAIGGSINDIISDFTIAQGDQIDLSELLKGLAAGTDLEAGGYVKIEQTGVNTSTVSVDVDGGGNSYQAVAELQNLTYNSATTDTVKILFEDNSGTKHTDNV
jgi:T1SS-143 domain-containing protein